MTLRSTDGGGFVFRTEDGDVKVTYEDRISIQTYLRRFEGTLVSVHLSRRDRKIVFITDKNQLMQLPFRDIVHLDVVDCMEKEDKNDRI